MVKTDTKTFGYGSQTYEWNGLSSTGLPAAKGGTDQVKAGLDSALAGGGAIDQLEAGVAAAKATAGCAGDPTCVGTLNAVAAGLDGSSSSLRARLAWMSAVMSSCGNRPGTRPFTWMP